ncbi:MAG TPA: hypothetical protein VFD23_05940 [Clostridia bacterium]|nr:hypothetical protein [Clostridia bacterium]
MAIFDIIKRTTALLVAVVTFLTATFGTTIGMTQGDVITATQQEYCYDNDRLLIGGYNYDLRFADAQHVAYVKQAGIDFLISGANQAFLDLCAQHGVGVIAKSYNAPAMYWDASNNSAWYNISPTTYKDHPALWGDDVIDEPTTAGFAALGSVVEHYYANTTGKIPLINLFPMYANADQLGNSEEISKYKQFLLPYSDFSDPYIDRYKRHISDYINHIDTDYISVDIYPLGVRTDDKGNRILRTDERWLRNLDVLAEACRETGRDLWVITQAAGNDIVDGGRKRYCDTPEDIRWQAYVSLAFGTKAIIHACYSGGWWDSDSHLIDANGNRTDTYYAVQTVDNELKTFADIYGAYDNLGAFLHIGAAAAGTKYGFLMPVAKDAKPDVASLSPLLVGCFAGKDGSSKAFSVVNMNEPQTGRSAKAKLTFDDVAKITIYQKGVATVINAKTCSLNLENREGVFITVE